MHERFWEFLAKYWAERISPEEKAEMERLLLEHPDHWLKTGLMQQISWKPEQMLSDKQTDRIADKALGNKSHPSSRLRGRKPFRVLYWRLVMITVAILLITSFLLVMTRSRTGGGGLWQRVTTAEGMKTAIQLADGSEVWLNAGSVLRYPDRFEGNTREVYLSGEAYVRIAPADSLPFIVHTGDMDVKARQGEINVRDYLEEPYSEAVLLAGNAAVTVNRDRKEHRIRLKALQKIVSRKTDVSRQTFDTLADTAGQTHPAVAGSIMLEPVDTLAGGITAESAWKTNVFLCRDEPLGTLVNKIARWYGVSVRIGDSSLVHQRFSVRLDDPPLPGLLHALQRTALFNYELKDHTLTIR
jgi:ferric-dicitrate binding protein FerR (iron transport regulator)